MKNPLSIILALGLLCASAIENTHASPNIRLQFIVRALPLSNLIYQLDCMATKSHCSDETFSSLWKSELKWNSQDEKELDRWRKVRDKYNGEIEFNEPKSDPMALPWSGPTGTRIEDKFSIATYHATDEKSLFSHWETIVSPTDLHDLEAVVHHFEPRFLAWWQQDAREESAQFANKIRTSLSDPKAMDHIQSFARFFGVDFPENFPLYIELFFRPRGTNAHTSGTLVENHSVLEFIPGEAASDRLDVVVHELCHFFYSSGSGLHKRQLTQSFADSPDPYSLAALNLLNEGVATALGNGIAGELWKDPEKFKKTMITEKSLYNDEAIDATGKALIPFLKEILRSKKMLYSPGFSEAYVQLLKEKIPSLLKMPARLLSKTVLFLSPATLPLIKNRTTWIPEEDQVALKRKFESTRSFVYGIQRFPSTYFFIVGGFNSDDISREFSRLIQAKDRFNGFLEN